MEKVPTGIPQDPAADVEEILGLNFHIRKRGVRSGCHLYTLATQKGHLDIVSLHGFKCTQASTKLHARDTSPSLGTTPVLSAKTKILHAVAK